MGVVSTAATCHMLWWRFGVMSVSKARNYGAVSVSGCYGTAERNVLRMADAALGQLGDSVLHRADEFATRLRLATQELAAGLALAGDNGNASAASVWGPFVDSKLQHWGTLGLAALTIYSPAGTAVYSAGGAEKAQPWEVVQPLLPERGEGEGPRWAVAAGPRAVPHLAASLVVPYPAPGGLRGAVLASARFDALSGVMRTIVPSGSKMRVFAVTASDWTKHTGNGSAGYLVAASHGATMRFEAGPEGRVQGIPLRDTEATDPVIRAAALRAAAVSGTATGTCCPGHNGSTCPPSPTGWKGACWPGASGATTMFGYEAATRKTGSSPVRVSWDCLDDQRALLAAAASSCPLALAACPGSHAECCARDAGNLTGARSLRGHPLRRLCPVTCSACPKEAPPSEDFLATARRHGDGFGLDLWVISVIDRAHVLGDIESEALGTQQGIRRAGSDHQDTRRHSLAASAAVALVVAAVFALGYRVVVSIADQMRSFSLQLDSLANWGECEPAAECASPVAELAELQLRIKRVDGVMQEAKRCGTIIGSQVCSLAGDSDSEPELGALRSPSSAFRTTSPACQPGRARSPVAGLLLTTPTAEPVLPPTSPHGSSSASSVTSGFRRIQSIMRSTHGTFVAVGHFGVHAFLDTLSECPDAVDTPATILERVVSSVLQVATKHGGSCHNISGDRLLICFNTTSPVPAHQVQARRCAAQLTKNRSTDPSKPQLSLGITTGAGFAGSLNLGSTRTPVHISTAVSAAYAVERYNKIIGTHCLLDGAVAHHLGGQGPLLPVGQLLMPKRSPAPFTVFTEVPLPPGGQRTYHPMGATATQDLWGAVVAAMDRGEWSEANAVLSRLGLLGFASTAPFARLREAVARGRLWDPVVLEWC